MRKIIISSNTSWNIINFRIDLLKKFKINNYEVILVIPFDDDKIIERLKYMGFKLINLKINSRNLNIIDNLYLLIQ